ncbi:MAG TPA: FlgD immunoglobulin-like domain containing protein [Candidatus Krumholzibacteria bacterium]
MVRQFNFARAARVLPALVVVSALHAQSAGAALQPGRPPMASRSSAASMAAPGEPGFVCGTYRGNEREIATRRALHLRNQKDLEQGLKASAPAFAPYIYDNVWIVQDDGSLTISGNNLFDNDVHTFLYTKSGTAYTVSQPAFNYDATLGSLIAPGDDGAVLVTLPFSFPFAGANWTQMYVSGNGAVSFGAGINGAFYDPADFFSATPKIAPYYLDLNEAAGGDVRVRSEAGKYTVTFISVREFGTFATNTFQLVLYPTGNFSITFNGMGSNVADNGSPIITGFHPGGDPPLEEINFNIMPHVGAAGAAIYEQFYSYPLPLVDEVALFQTFYQTFPDEFFQVVFFTNFSEEMGGAFAYERNIRNNVSGIGLGIFNGSGQYGSDGTLESLCNMGFLNQWTNPDPTARVFGKGNNFLTIMGQESGHRWGAFVYFDKGSGPSNLLLGRSDAHWSYYADIDHSSLEGGDWVNTGGSNYSCPTLIDYFSEIDEYLFGLRTADEVKDMFYVSSASNDQVVARSQGTPLQGSTCSGTYVGVTVEDIIAAEGTRTPLPTSAPHDLRQAFIFLVAAGTTPSQLDLDKIAGFRRAWEEYFEKSCDGRLACNTSLAGPYPVGVISGEARDRYSQHLVPELTARSVERSFTQHVPAGGKFMFRYDDSPTRGSGEPVTLIFSAPGYQPDTLVTNITYGASQSLVGLPSGIWLTPVATGAGASPALTVLGANHPNPFNPQTSIEYTLGQPGPVRLLVYDAAGRHVRTLVDRAEAKGEHRVIFDGRDDGGRPLASGVYLYRLDAGGVSLSRKMVLLK